MLMKFQIKFLGEGEIIWIVEESDARNILRRIFCSCILDFLKYQAVPLATSPMPVTSKN
jgi:hypothetical protein